jgi:hypothetical protein
VITSAPKKEFSTPKRASIWATEEDKRKKKFNYSHGTRDVYAS